MKLMSRVYNYVEIQDYLNVYIKDKFKFIINYMSIVFYNL